MTVDDLMKIGRAARTAYIMQRQGVAGTLPDAERAATVAIVRALRDEFYYNMHPHTVFFTAGKVALMFNDILGSDAGEKVAKPVCPTCKGAGALFGPYDPSDRTPCPECTPATNPAPTVGQRLIRAAKEAAAIARGEDTDAAPAHEWFQFSNLVACRACGVVRRADDKNNPCKGPVRVALRDTDAAPAVCVWTRVFDSHVNRKWRERGCDGAISHWDDVCPSCGKPIVFTEAK